MDAILVHGMGRTPVSQILLAERLRSHGITPALFGYTTLATFDATRDRLAERIHKLDRSRPIILIGHSLGAVLIRASLPHLDPVEPAAIFLLGAPAVACRAARHFTGNPLFGLLTGDMGRHLADEKFMNTLPVPAAPTWIYAGNAGPRGPHSPFGDEPNDGILTVAETAIAGVPLVTVNALHTFIMNSREVASHMLGVIAALTEERGNAAP